MIYLVKYLVITSICYTTYPAHFAEHETPQKVYFDTKLQAVEWMESNKSDITKKDFKLDSFETVKPEQLKFTNEK